MGIVSKFESTFGDIDEVFGFRVAKRVVIKDRFLGFLRISLLIAIFVYLIFTIFIDKGYLIIEQPTGTTRMTMRLNPDNVFANSNLSYCTNPPTGIPKPYFKGNVHECLYVNQDVINVPSLGDQFFIPTRLKKSVVEYKCNLTDAVCSLNNKADITTEKSKDLWFIAGVEEGTIYLGHTVEGKGEVAVARDLTEMIGVMKDCSGKVVKRFPKKDPNQPLDEDLVKNRIIRVGDLLKWARPGMHSPCGNGIQLDVRARPDEVNHTESLRYEGLVLHILIDYDNTQETSFDYESNTVEYTITVVAITKTDPKYLTVKDLGGNQKEINNRHGIHIIVVQTGKLGNFSWKVLVVSFTAGLGLMAIATTLTSMLAVFVMPLKADYKKVMYEYSADFSDVRDQREMEDKETPLIENEQVDFSNVSDKKKVLKL